MATSLALGGIRVQIPRALEPMITDALRTFRVVIVTGPRQAGKTTVVRRTIGDDGTFARLDDESVLQAARVDPAGFAAFGRIPRAFDEVQRGGDPLIRAIKSVVDDDPTPGQFLLNGSADFLTVPTLSESLAGRAALLDFWPLSQSEIERTGGRFLRLILESPEALLELGPSGVAPSEYLERICRGGFPEAVAMPQEARSRWYSNYVRTVTERDITELTGARRARQLPRVLALIAARTANELVVSHIHDDSGLGSRATTEDYIGYLQMAYLIRLLPAWSRNLTRKVARHPKVHVVDSGLAAQVLGKTPEALARPTDPARGQLLESFVVNELTRQAGMLHANLRFHHLRGRDGAEVDLVVEHGDGTINAFEIKSSATATPADAKWLAWLRDKTGDDFRSGTLLYTGERPFKLGDRLAALPISQLWQA